MILFRRLRRGVKQISSRDWALLTLETAGVLAGILIAFQLNEWASRRNQAARHDQLMERLFEESEFGVAGLRGWRDRMRQIVDQESKFAVSLAAGRCPPDADWVAANTVHMMPAVVAPTSVYQELMGAGGRECGGEACNYRVPRRSGLGAAAGCLLSRQSDRDG